MRMKAWIFHFHNEKEYTNMLRRTCLKLIAADILGLYSGVGMGTPNQTHRHGVPILLYHRLGPTVADSMTVRTPVFEAHLDLLLARGYSVISLDHIVKALQQGLPLPAKSVALCADDGHRSVHDIMLPLVKERGIHVTAFIYPSAISNASYAMTWQQLRALLQSGCFDIQSHTFWHPNFNHEKKKLSETAYQDFVRWQLLKSKQRLESGLNISISMLAWPYGIYNDELVKIAQETGYTAAFTLVQEPVRSGDKLLTLPRFLMADDGGTRQLERILQASSVNI